MHVYFLLHRSFYYNFGITDSTKDVQLNRNFSVIFH